MTSLKRGGVRKKGKKGSNNWTDPMASLNPNENMSRRQDDLEDVSQYLHKLSEEERIWMARFMNEYNNAKLDFKDLSNNLHNTQELKKACTDRNNARNRCIYTMEKAKGMLNYAGSDAELETYIYENREAEEEEFILDDSEEL
jgi:hypothetical protein